MLLTVLPQSTYYNATASTCNCERITGEGASVEGDCFTVFVANYIIMFCQDTPGFIVNRLLVPYMAEAVRMAERGMCVAL